MMMGMPEGYVEETPEERDKRWQIEDGLANPARVVVIEDQEVRTVSATGGEKGTKLARFDLIPVEALTELANHYGRGAKKYDDDNWRRGYEWKKSYAAMQRHANAFWGGEDIDEETGTPHIIAVAWHAFTLFTFMQEFPEYDGRHKK
jgi:hypothetical protein